MKIFHILILGFLVMGTPAGAQNTGTLEVFGEQIILPPDSFRDPIQISSKGHHSLALLEDGSVLGWGANNSGECDVPAFDEPVVFLEAGFSRSAALTESGAFFSWGQNPYGAGDTPDSNLGFIDIGSGYLHNLILRDSGVIVSQGLSYHGGEVVPEPNSGWVDIAAFDDQSMGLKDDGTIWLWGTVTDTIAAHDPAFVRVVAGASQAFALDAAGTVHHFGIDYHGSSELPENNIGFVDVSAGDGQAMALRPDGSIEAWGWDHHGQASPPTSALGYADVECGYFHSLAIDNDGKLVLWGNNGNAELGLQPPVSDLVDVKMGQAFGIALGEEGAIATWGNIPAAPEPNEGFQAITAGHEFAAAIRADSTIVDWGSWGGYLLPEFDANEDFVALSAGRRILLGLRSDGSIAIRSVDNDGLHDIPQPNHGYSRISAGNGFCLALRGQDGSIVAWGSPLGGVLDVPEPNSGFVDVFAGYRYAFGVKENGTVVMWGQSDTVPESLNHDTRSLDTMFSPYWTTLHTDGTISLWFGGDLPAPNSGIMAMDAGGLGVAILRSNPTVAVPDDTPAQPLPSLSLDAYPSPFNPLAHIELVTPRDGRVLVDVVDLRGRRVRTLWQGWMAAGEKRPLRWDGRGDDGQLAASGVYLLRATGEDGIPAFRKVTFVK